MNYYKFIDEQCRFEISDNLVFCKGEVSLDKNDYILLFQVKTGYEERIESLLDKNIHTKLDVGARGRKITSKKYDWVYNEGNIKQRYLTSFSGKGKIEIEVHLYLIEQDGKLYFFVYTW